MATFRDQASVINGFLTSQPQPSCIIAHNGHQFDFPLLQAELCNANHALPIETEIWCADSLEAFRVLDGLPAVPEWLVEKRNAEKQRMKNADHSTSKVQRGDKSSLKKNDTSEGPNDQSASKKVKENNGDSEDMPARKPKRQADVINTSAAISKLPKMDPATEGFNSQTIVTDSQLVEASDTLLAKVSADAANLAAAVSTQQSHLETTPTQSPGRVSGSDAGVADQFVKRQQPPTVNPSERERVARRLFDSQPSTSADALPQNAEHLTAASEAAAAAAARESGSKGESFSQGSLSDEDFAQLVQHADSEASVTSLVPTNAGAGDHVEPLPLPHAQQEQPENENKTSEEKNRVAIDNTPTKLCSNLPQTALSMVSAHTLKTTQTQSPSSSKISGVCSIAVGTHSSLCSSSWVSYKLGEIYKREFGCHPDTAHTAEDDCISLLKLIMKKSSEFMSFVEDHAVAFDTVAPGF